jgi:hypothetical protein
MHLISKAYLPHFDRSAIARRCRKCLLDAQEETRRQSMVRVITAIALSMLALSAQSQTILPYTFTKQQDIKAAHLQADLDVLLAAVNGLSARVSKLEGNITVADLAGNYWFDGFQTELGSHYVANYVYHGTATLTMTAPTGGEITLSSPETGTQLNFGSPFTIGPFSGAGGGSYSVPWNFTGGTVNIGDATSGGLAVVAGGRLLVGAFSNPPPAGDGTQVLLLLTRKN